MKTGYDAGISAFVDLFCNKVNGAYCGTEYMTLLGAADPVPFDPCVDCAGFVGEECSQTCKDGLTAYSESMGMCGGFLLDLESRLGSCPVKFADLRTYVSTTCKVVGLFTVTGAKKTLLKVAQEATFKEKLPEHAQTLLADSYCKTIAMVTALKIGCTPGEVPVECTIEEKTSRRRLLQVVEEVFVYDIEARVLKVAESSSDLLTEDFELDTEDLANAQDTFVEEAAVSAGVVMDKADLSVPVVSEPTIAELAAEAETENTRITQEYAEAGIAEEDIPSAALDPESKATAKPTPVPAWDSPTNFGDFSGAISGVRAPISGLLLLLAGLSLLW